MPPKHASLCESKSAACCSPSPTPQPFAPFASCERRRPLRCGGNLALALRSHPHSASHSVHTLCAHTLPHTVTCPRLQEAGGTHFGTIKRQNFQSTLVSTFKRYLFEEET